MRLNNKIDNELTFQFQESFNEQDSNLGLVILYILLAVGYINLCCKLII